MRKEANSMPKSGWMKINMMLAIILFVVLFAQITLADSPSDADVIQTILANATKGEINNKGKGVPLFAERRRRISYECIDSLYCV